MSGTARDMVRNDVKDKLARGEVAPDLRSAQQARARQVRDIALKREPAA